MIVKNLYLENFRNYDMQTIDFGEKKNVFYGLNGQGKTNIIEALYYFCTCKSFRSIYDKEIIKFGCDYSKINLEFEASKRENNAQIFITEKKSVKLNGANLERLSELIGKANMVIFTPSQLNLIREGPGVRRNFLDILISQIKPLYFKNLMFYYKILKQRNIILKSKNKKMTDTIDVWDEKLAQYGVNICLLRDKYLKKMNYFLNMLEYNNENISISYNPSIKDDFSSKDNFINILKKSIDKDLEKGMTLIGPHRDDFNIDINGISLKKYGSQGQTRTGILKMKIAECEMINEITGEQPLLLLDDILSELDEKRRKYFMEKIKDRQVIITCTDKEFIKDKESCFFNVNKGSVRKE